MPGVLLGLASWSSNWIAQRRQSDFFRVDVCTSLLNMSGVKAIFLVLMCVHPY